VLGHPAVAGASDAAARRTSSPGSQHPSTTWRRTARGLRRLTGISRRWADHMAPTAAFHTMETCERGVATGQARRDIGMGTDVDSIMNQFVSSGAHYHNNRRPGVQLQSVSAELRRQRTDVHHPTTHGDGDGPSHRPLPPLHAAGGAHTRSPPPPAPNPCRAGRFPCRRRRLQRVAHVALRAASRCRPPPPSRQGRRRSVQVADDSRITLTSLVGLADLNPRPLPQSVSLPNCATARSSTVVGSAITIVWAIWRAAHAKTPKRSRTKNAEVRRPVTELDEIAN